MGGYTSKFDPTILETAIDCYTRKYAQIKKLNLKQYYNSTCIEYLNYLNTYFYENVLYKNVSQEEFISEVKLILKRKDVKEAIEQVRKYKKYDENSHIAAMIHGDAKHLYEIEVEMCKKNRWKQWIKKILLKLKF